ncbi:hypothetical protein PMPD1_2037 [Paramixta manurensis]|uniref:Uncharacterized protein n=1 Tax=Paramixta manurensis TaxID=2740817 RepID=A0A6M8U8K7_9GAMM|nr:hypothetical protein PMPD1_2037 [Erwiniaceae bacterium PD-1]
MNSVRALFAKFCRFIGFQTASLVEGIATGLCSFAAFFSLFLLDGWWKILGFIGFFLLAYGMASLLDRFKREE